MFPYSSNAWPTSLRRCLGGDLRRRRLPDRTWRVVKDIGARDARVRCLRRIGRRGLSGACLEGVLASQAPLVCIMDADLQHDETLLPSMLEILRRDESDLVVAHATTTADPLPVFPQTERAKRSIAHRSSAPPLRGPLRNLSDFARSVWGKTGSGSAVVVACCDDQVGLVAAQDLEHGWEQRFIVLEIGVHDANQRRLAGKHAFETGTRQSAPADAAQTAYARIPRADVLDDAPRAIRGVVVDEDHLPGNAAKDVGQAFDE